MECVLRQLSAGGAGHVEQLLMPMVSSSCMVHTFRMLGWFVLARINGLVDSVVAGGSATLRGSPASVVAAAGTTAGDGLGGCVVAGHSVFWMLPVALGRTMQDCH